MNLAFISYSHHDIKVADWLQTRLEHYRLPPNMPNPVNPDNHYLRPIFRDRTDLTTGVLSEIIDKNLEKSKYLILICSRRSARSQWVSKEVQYFIEHGRIHQIIPIVIDGIPYSGGPRECMPKYMRDHVEKHPEEELLCIDMVADGESRTFMQVVSRLMDVPFDVMYARHRRHMHHVIGNLIFCGSLVLGALAYLVTPISLSVHLYDEILHLPRAEGSLWVDGQKYVVADSTYNVEIPVSELPGFRRGSTVDVMFAAPFYDTVRATLDLGIGLHSDLDLELHRDGTFSIFSGVVLETTGEPIAGASVDIGGYECITDLHGYFELHVPPKSQQVSQPIYITKDGYFECTREDESPDTDLKYILYRQ